MLSRLLPRVFVIRRMSTKNSNITDLRNITTARLPRPLQPPTTQSEAEHGLFDTECTKLESNIRVASQPFYGTYCTIGVAIKSGSRYEGGYPAGTSHLVEKLAFGSTLRHFCKEEIYEVLQKAGGLVDCQSNRNITFYAASCHISSLDTVMEILANALWRAKNTQEELEEAKMIAQFENEDLTSKIENVEMLLNDRIHMAAFRQNTLGMSKYTPEDSLSAITQAHVNSYISQYHVSERLIVAGVGVEHGELVAAVERHFGPGTAIWERDSRLLLPQAPKVDSSVAKYTGGEVRIGKDLSAMAIGTPYPNLAHIALGFEGVRFGDPDFVPICVLQMLLGGGGSFSSGGPGKGMYTRLYTDVMSRHHWIYGATAYNHSYADAGVFCVHVSSDPKLINDALVVVLDQFFKLLKGVEEAELQRAKIQLKSQLMMSLEIRPAIFENIARQMMYYGHVKRPEEIMEEIDRVTNEDIARVAERMLTTRPSLVGFGDLKEVSSYEALSDAVADRSVRKLQRKNLKFW